MLLVGNFLQMSRPESGTAGSQLLIIEMRHISGNFVVVHVAADNVFRHDIQAVKCQARAESTSDRWIGVRRTSFSICVGASTRHGSSNVFTGRARHRGDAAEDVDDRFLHAIFRLELKIFVVELDRDVGENR